MAQILDPVPSDRGGHILCCYVNATSKIQIARITNIPNWYFERVVFPGQRLVFEGFPEALLEIHTGMMASAILSDKIPCQRLAIRQEKDDLGGNSSPNSLIKNKSELETNHKNAKTTKPLMAATLTAID